MGNEKKKKAGKDSKKTRGKQYYDGFRAGYAVGCGDAAGGFQYPASGAERYLEDRQDDYYMYTDDDDDGYARYYYRRNYADAFRNGSLMDFIDSLTPSEQRQTLIYLSERWAETESRANDPDAAW